MLTQHSTCLPATSSREGMAPGTGHTGQQVDPCHPSGQQVDPCHPSGQQVDPCHPSRESMAVGVTDYLNFYAIEWWPLAYARGSDLGRRRWLLIGSGVNQ